MASPKLLLLLATSLLSCLLVAADYAPMTLTVVNNCPYPVWPGIQAISGHDDFWSSATALLTAASKPLPIVFG